MKSNVRKRRYQMFADFTRVHEFLTDTYNPTTLNSFLLPQYFEYAHHHSFFNHKLSHRFGVWEQNEEIVGIACFEMDLGESHLHVEEGYEYLLPELLDWAEKELCRPEEGKYVSGIWITDKEPDKREMLKSRGYELVRTDRVTIFDYKKPFPETALPEGFKLICGHDADYNKLHACYWKGFDHGDNPDNDVDGTIHACNAPNGNLSLDTIVVAPNGEYACALGMWHDEQNEYAYLEPLATVPKYRRMGLAKAALVASMEITKQLGANYCFTGGGEFYTAIGCEIICDRELWKREWQNVSK